MCQNSPFPFIKNIESSHGIEAQYKIAIDIDIIVIKFKLTQCTQFKYL